jgi:tagatose-1,6-bisphosphate aldolase non-catalytic subunit AgaZ/GatZ
MQIARQSFEADIEAGFNYLHIDPTKCPFPYTQEQLVEWTVDLMMFCEETRKKLQRPELDYEVGTEDIQGGLSSPEAFERFLNDLAKATKERGLPRPTCIVGQTGTLTRADYNVGHFDSEGARRLADIAARYSIGFKEHNADYLSDITCRAHPSLNVTGANVAPEFGLVETDACLDLVLCEQKLVREGWLAESTTSCLDALLHELTFRKAPWRKWMDDGVRGWDDEKVRTDKETRRLIARVCGHYVYDFPAFRAARATLYANLDRFRGEGWAENHVRQCVRTSITSYIESFNLKGTNRLTA